MQGIVKVVKPEKGFGFISADGEKDIFFHASALVDGLYFDDLKEGDSVAFDVEASDRGDRAINVALAQ